MVRFWVGFGDKAEGVAGLFQFHYGAVLSFDSVYLDADSEISIPLWCGSEFTAPGLFRF